MEPRCPFCGETRLLDKLTWTWGPPREATGEPYYCAVCAHTFVSGKVNGEAAPLGSREVSSPPRRAD